MAAALSQTGRRQAFVAAARRELQALLASPWDWGMVTVLPAVMLVVLTWLFTAGAMHRQPVVVVDQDNSAASRQLVRALDASPGLKVVARIGNPEEGWSRIRRLDAIAMVLVPSRTSRELLRGEPGTVFAYYNASYLAPGQAAARDIGDAVSAFNRAWVVDEVAMRAPARVKGPPVAVQSAILFNQARSFEHFLLGLLFPAVLHLVAALAMTASLGRELRDGNAREWLRASGGHGVAMLAGKLAPYVGLFTLYGLAGLLYLAVKPGIGLAGSLPVLLCAQILLYTACAGLALLCVGASRDMGTALSVIGVSVGTAMAFAGATFPVIGAPLFTRVWNVLLPLTAYVKVQAQQLDMGAPWQSSLLPLGTLLLLTLVPGTIGGMLFLRIARKPVAIADARQ